MAKADILASLEQFLLNPDLTGFIAIRIALPVIYHHVPARYRQD